MLFHTQCHLEVDVPDKSLFDVSFSNFVCRCQSMSIMSLIITRFTLHTLFGVWFTNVQCVFYNEKLDH